MHRPEDDTYKCPDCDNTILRKEFSSHPEVCGQTKRVVNQKPAEFDNDITQNVETNRILYEAKNSKKEPGPRQSKYSGKYHCTSCDKVFTSINGRYSHKRNVHEGLRYSCEQCNQIFTQPQSLKMHEQRRHTIHKIHTNGFYPCKSCHMIFRSSYGYWQHKRFVHDGFRYNCDQCDCKFTTFSSLKNHQKSEHEGVRFNCDQCEHKSARKDNLQQHKIHKHAFSAPPK